MKIVILAEGSTVAFWRACLNAADASAMMRDRRGRERERVCVRERESINVYYFHSSHHELTLSVMKTMLLIIFLVMMFLQ